MFTTSLFRQSYEYGCQNKIQVSSKMTWTTLGCRRVAAPLYILGSRPELRPEIPRVPGLHYGTVLYTLLNTLV